jgi:poly(hydroxyalkanoate) granule-associated protein
MAKKALKKKVPAKASAGKLTDQVVDSARDIWLAGLGALSVAQKEGGKVLESGNKLFDKLVEEGNKIERSTRQDVEGAVTDLRGDVESRVESVRKQASDNWDKLENVFEERVARVLGRMGVPTADDVNKLSARVQKLSDQVAALADAKAKPAAKSAAKPAAKAPARKSTAKKAAAKPAAKKAAPKASSKKAA